MEAGKESAERCMQSSGLPSQQPHAEDTGIKGSKPASKPATVPLT